MTRYSYDRQFWAHYGDELVVVPDQVAADQKGYAERNEAFPAIVRGETIMMLIDAEATGLWTPGTGDLVVRRA
jgi:hypothetical protein